MSSDRKTRHGMRRLCGGINLIIVVSHIAWGAITPASVQQQVMAQWPVHTSSIHDNSVSTRHLSVPLSATPSSHVALVLFFLSTCPHCQRFAPIVKHDAVRHHIPVYAFSLDGAGLPDFPHPLPTTSTIRQAFFGQSRVVAPTLFLVNVNSLQGIEITQGDISATALNQRVNTATQQLMEWHHAQ